MGGGQRKKARPTQLFFMVMPAKTKIKNIRLLSNTSGIKKKVYFFNQPFEERAEIMRITKGEGGVYCWLNKMNNKRYVGSTINLPRRLSDYYSFSPQYKGESMILAALQKYGLINFTLMVIIIPESNKDSVIALEQYLMDILNPEYNILKVAGSTAGKVYSSEYKKNMSKILGKEIYLYSRDYNLLHIFTSKKKTAKDLLGNESTISKYLYSDQKYRDYFILTTKLIESGNIKDTNSLEEITKIALEKKTRKGKLNSMFGVRLTGEKNHFFGKKHTEETRVKMSKAKGTSIYIYSKNGSLLNSFTSANLAGKYLQVNHQTILKYADSGKLLKGEWLIRTSPIPFVSDV